jgi:hypothetical protein
MDLSRLLNASSDAEDIVAPAGRIEGTLEPGALAAEVDRSLAADPSVAAFSGAETLVPAVRAVGRKKRRRRPSAKQLRDKSQRDVDNSKILNLTLDVNDLRQQVHACVVQKSLWETRQLVARQQFHSRSLRSVERFFQLFQSGYPQVLPVNDQRFLAALLDENVSVGGGIKGQAQFLEQWRRYKRFFSVRYVSTRSMKVVASDSAGCLIECIGLFEGRVTAAALQSVFPAALEDEALVKHVRYRRFTCPTQTLISLNSSGRLVQFDAYSDVFKAMGELLEFNPFRVATLMENALISEGSLLPPAPYVSENNGCSLDASRDGDGTTSSASSSGSSKSSVDSILS